MALNQYMHPRNIYKTPPDFAALALKYPHFLHVSKMDINGKVHIDFKDANALRVLTTCLLHKDFGLSVDIPVDRLVPTLPLRLNYMLWIEDLMNSVGRKDDILGIDIGTGACAIYPLLAAVQNKWKMIGTETDVKSIEIAEKNIKNNNLTDLIKVKVNSTTSTLEHVFAEDALLKVDFCVCNPPFYSTMEELYESRSTSRPQPKNGFTGSPQELVTEGGEIEFVKKIIEESENLKTKVKIYTTMLGHKYSLNILLDELQQKAVQEFTHTEFCQGRTTRWGLAWTFCDNILLRDRLPPRREARKKTQNMSYIIPPLANCVYDTPSIANVLKSIFDKLSIRNRIIEKRGSKLTIEIKAYENTWSNQRRKRRLLQKMNVSSDNSKVPKIHNLGINVQCDNCDINCTENHINCQKEHDSSKDDKTLDVQTENTTFNNNLIEKSECNTLDNSETTTTEPNVNEKIASDISNKIKFKEKKTVTLTLDKTDSTESEDSILHCLVILRNVEEKIMLEMSYIGGTLHKDGMHQVIQYIKNNWK